MKKRPSALSVIQLLQKHQKLRQNTITRESCDWVWVVSFPSVTKEQLKEKERFIRRGVFPVMLNPAAWKESTRPPSFT